MEGWADEKRWAELVRGENCPLCAAVAADEPEDEHGITMADLPYSRVRLARNQYVQGYTVVIANRHVREPYELGRQERIGFFDDVMRVGQALETVFQPVKMNFQLLGNSVPHLHCHMVPRYHGDPAPGWPIDPYAETVELEPDEYPERVDAIARALGV